MRRTKIVCTMGPNTDKKNDNACTRKKWNGCGKI